MQKNAATCILLMLHVKNIRLSGVKKDKIKKFYYILYIVKDNKNCYKLILYFQKTSIFVSNN